MLYAIFGILAVAALVSILLVLKKKNLPTNIPPVVPTWIPYVGAGIEFGKYPLQFVTKCYERYGDIFTVPVMGQRLTFLVGPEAHAPFFRASDEEMDQNEPYKFSVPIFGPNVVFDAPLWKRTQQLKIMSHSLRAEKLRSYVPLIVKEAEDFFRKWGDEGVVDIRKEFSELTILTAARTLMGEEIRETMSDRVAKLYQDLDEGLTTLSFFFPYAPIHAHKKRDEARQEMVHLFTKVIQERRRHPEIEHNDVLQVFMDATYKNKETKEECTCTEEEVTGLMIALLFAGQHTSSITASWTGLLLLQNKSKFLSELLQEQNDVMSGRDTIDFQALQEMVALKRCIMEALRMYPPLIFVMRKVLKSFEYKGKVVPEGDTVFVSPALSHRVKEAFQSPDEYNPHRFKEPMDEDKRPLGFIGFGAGRHGCMGEQFAYLQIKTIWSVLFRDFDLELAGPLPEPDYLALVVGPKPGPNIRFKRKQKVAQP